MSDFSGRGGGLFFRQGGTSFLSEGHPMGSSILMGEGGIQKNRRMGGGGEVHPLWETLATSCMLQWSWIHL